MFLLAGILVAKSRRGYSCSSARGFAAWAISVSLQKYQILTADTNLATFPLPMWRVSRNNDGSCLATPPGSGAVAGCRGVWAAVQSVCLAVQLIKHAAASRSSQIPVFYWPLSARCMISRRHDLRKPATFITSLCNAATLCLPRAALRQLRYLVLWASSLAGCR